MNGFFAFAQPVPPTALYSATSQDGARMGPVIANPMNVGAMALKVESNLSADVDLVAELLSTGNVGFATWKASIDNGATWLGRKAQGTWDGNGATERLVLADTGTNGPQCSKPVQIDLDGDGIAERAVWAVFRDSTTPDQIDIMYTDNLETGAGAAVLASNVTDLQIPTVRPALLEKNGTLFLFTIISGSGLCVFKSMDGGATWGTKTVIDAGGIDVRAIKVKSGRLVAFYTETISSYNQICCRSSVDGKKWSAQKQVTSDSWHHILMDPFQTQEGKSVVFYGRSGVGTYAKQTTKADPAAGSWSQYYSTGTTDPIWSSSGLSVDASFTIAPDGTIFGLLSYAGGDLKLTSMKTSAGEITFSTPALVYDVADEIWYPALGCIGGALWCLATNYTDLDAILVMSRYWTTYNETTAPASWTSVESQYVKNGLLVKWIGSGGEEGDSWSAATVYDYGAHRMLLGRPAHPTRSVADDAAWEAIFDLSALRRFPIDTVLVMANVDAVTLQQSDSLTFTGGTTVSLVEETVDENDVTISGWTATRATGTFSPSLIGKKARFGTGRTFTVVDVVGAVLYASVDLTDETGDLKLLAGRGWAWQTLAAKPYLRVSIAAQKVEGGKYEIGALFPALRSMFSDSQIVLPPSWTRDVEDKTTGRGETVRTTKGPGRREVTVSYNLPTREQERELVARFDGLGPMPLALVPNDDNGFYWMLCHLTPDVQIDLDTTTIQLVEVP